MSLAVAPAASYSNVITRTPSLYFMRSNQLRMHYKLFGKGRTKVIARIMRSGSLARARGLTFFAVQVMFIMGFACTLEQWLFQLEYFRFEPRRRSRSCSRL